MAWSGFEKNYYGMLELSVDTFISDIPTLEKAYSDHVRKWTSSNKPELKNRDKTIGKDIQNAFHNPDEWKRIYDELKSDIDTALLESREMAGGSLTDESKESLCQNYRVSLNYLNSLFGDTSSSDSKTETSVEDKRDINDIKPDNKVINKLRNLNSTLKGMAYKSIFEFVYKMLGTEIDANTCTKDDIMGPVTDLQKTWSKKASQGSNAEMKSAVEKIYNELNTFFSVFTIEDFRQWMVYNNVNEILIGITTTINNASVGDSSVLSERLYNNKIDAICEFVSDRKLSTAILRNYCKSNGIGLPAKIPNSATCPFCYATFERAETPHTKCPSCLTSFIVECPKCKKQKNLIMDSECDGIQLSQYPFFKKKLLEAEELGNSLAFGRAMSIINEIEAEWPNFPRLDKVKTACNEIKSKCGKDIAELQQRRSRNEYYAAKAICDRIESSYPGFKKHNDDIYKKVDYCDKQLAQVESEKDEDKKTNMLLAIVSEVSDCTRAISILKGLSLYQPENIKVISDNARNSISVSWTSKNKPYTVDYVVLRQEGRKVSNDSDGVEVFRTQSTSISDSTVENGKEYYYAVYSCRGPINSPICVSEQPAVILKKPDNFKTTISNRSVDVSWSGNQGVISVFYDTKPISAYKSGNEIKNVTPSGFRLDSLVNDTTYYFAAFQVLKIGSSEYHSDGYYFEATPVVDIEKPVITKSIGKSDGDYILTYTNPDTTSVIEFFYSEGKAVVTANSSLSTSELSRRVKKLTTKPIDKTHFIVNHKGENSLVVYPAIISGATAFIGNSIEIKYVKPISVSQVSVAGSDLVFQLTEWPTAADTIYVCYNHDYYPEDIKDCEKAIQIKKSLYDATHTLAIRGLLLKEYYVSLFIRTGGDTVPIYNYYYDNRVKPTFYYSFNKSLLGGWTVQIESKSSGVRPSLKIAYKSGGIPLTVNDCQTSELISENKSFSKSETIKISPPRNIRNCHCRLFSDDSSYEMLIKGSAHLK